MWRTALSSGVARAWRRPVWSQSLSSCSSVARTGLRNVAPTRGTVTAAGSCCVWPSGGGAAALCTVASPVDEPREAMEYDVLVVGGGPAGLAAAIRLKQKQPDLQVCLVEKGAQIGAHILSGNVFETRALDELFPNWKELGAPLDTPATSDSMRFLTQKSSIPLPVVPLLNNHGNYIISLGKLCVWLAEQAEQLGVEIYPGFSASEVLYSDSGAVAGVATNDFGIGKNGQPKDTFQRGMELRAHQTLFAEGVRGSLSETLMQRFNLRENSDPQTYGIGLKEVWEIDESKHEAGKIVHTIGWPLDLNTYSGTFTYHMKPNLLLIGMVVGLDYKNPYLNPYMEFQRWKHHPTMESLLQGGRPIAYGARAINEGGYQSLPKLTFPGGALLGCSAGFLNVPKIKGSHMAMQSGITAADSVCEALAENSNLANQEITQYQHNMEKSWVYEELRSVRNYHPSFKYGLVPGVLYSGLSAFLLRGKEWWTMRHTKKDWEATKKASECKPIVYPKPDGVISFDLLTNLTRAGTNHEHDQPSHLKVKPELAHVPESVSFQEYAAPETRFCPAKVYEYTTDEDGSNPQLVINAQNCVHCKTCSIKTPHEYINWTVPEGGGGPSYNIM